jgi:hypothetical protein
MMLVLLHKNIESMIDPIGYNRDCVKDLVRVVVA